MGKNINALRNGFRPIIIIYCLDINTAELVKRVEKKQWKQ